MAQQDEDGPLICAPMPPFPAAVQETIDKVVPAGMVPSVRTGINRGMGAGA
ncbi:hypothetical protein [Flavisphingomonas formosensis]|uniref:hypothetical protein n=1 Tax=Flavisphingomonas formosensis TaxID=861534 RepID=UPI0012FC7053|nr:hypothetical protein [Sphingomonas formosensis]